MSDRISAGPAGARRVSIGHFVRLKLRITANGFRGQSWRIALFVSGLLGGLVLAVAGFLLLALPGLVDHRQLAEVTAGLGGAFFVISWTLLPLVLFGVDETLDPARFALLPLRRRTLVTGLFTAALVGVPALTTLVASTGLAATAWHFGGPVAGLVALLGVVAGLLLCVAASRAVTSAFAAMLRSRRMRDLAAVLLAVCAALLGPLQLAIAAAAEQVDWERLQIPARILGWTPLAAPYTVGMDIAEGRAWAVPVKLLIVGLAVSALLFWWSRSLESAMLGTADASGPAARTGTTGGVVASLLPRPLGWLPRNRHGALVAREVRYWWRDSRRRAGLITFAVVSIFLPVMVNVSGPGGPGAAGDLGPSATVAGVSMLFVGTVAAVTLANQFGYDGSAYAANVAAGVPGQVELRSRVAAFSIFIVPLLLLGTVVLALVLGELAWIGTIAGATFAGYGTGIAMCLLTSVLAPYALPETSNPFATSSGAGLVKGLLVLVVLVGATVAAAPVVVATALLDGQLWLWLALPVGVGYGLAAIGLGCHIAGDVLDHRMPELLTAVTPRR